MMKSLQWNPLVKGCLPLTVLAVFFSSPLAHALDLPPGARFVVRPSTPVQDYRLNGATLIVQPNAQTGAIRTATGSTVRIDGGTVTSTKGHAINIDESELDISNAVIRGSNPSASSSDSSAIRLNGRVNGSHATLTNSTVYGVGRGINAAGNSVLVLDSTDVFGQKGGQGVGGVRGDLGIGIVVASASAEVRNGSTVVGDHNGVVLMSSYTLPGDLVDARFTLDDSHVSGTEGSALLVTGRDNVALSRADIEINNGSTLSGGNGNILEVQLGADAHVNVTGSQLVGDILVSEDSTADLNLNHNASLTGKITHASALSIDGSSRWVMEGESSVGKLGLAGGTVDLRGSSAGFHSLTLGELSGAGTFALGTDLATQTGDFINVTGQATGQHQLLVQNSGVDPLLGDAPLQVVHTGSGDAAFSVVGEKVDFGTFAYQLQSEQNSQGGTDWSLVQTGDLSKSSEASIGLFSAAPTVWYGESATLRSRMGELRNGNDQGGGWVRTYGNRLNMSAGGGVAYKQVQQGISLGADMPVAVNDGQLLVGVMGGYSKSDLSMRQGTSGTIDSYYLGAYGTWLAEDGFYIDALIKANRFQNQSDVRMSDGVKAKGKYNNVGVGASIEVGKHIKLQDNWYIEPFAQGSGLLVGGESYELDNGMRASSNKADSLLGKVGTYVGRSFALDDGGFVQPYVKIAGAHEFVKNNQVKINDNRFTNDLSGSRIELGTGVSAQLTDVLQVHADVDYMRGRNIEQPWGVNVGLRYNW